MSRVPSLFHRVILNMGNKQGKHSSKDIIEEITRFEDGLDEAKLNAVFGYFARSDIKCGEEPKLTIAEMHKLLKKTLKYNKIYSQKDVELWLKTIPRTDDGLYIPRSHFTKEYAEARKKSQVESKLHTRVENEEGVNVSPTVSQAQSLSTPGLERFLFPQNRGFLGLSHETQGVWSGDYTFVQLADPQIGFLSAMLTQNVPRKWLSPTHVMFMGSVSHAEKEVGREAIPDAEPLSLNEMYELELEHSRMSIRAVNAMRPKPAFMVVCGDLVHAYPMDRPAPNHWAEQVQHFKQIFSQVDPDIALVNLANRSFLSVFSKFALW